MSAGNTPAYSAPKPCTHTQQCPQPVRPHPTSYSRSQPPPIRSGGVARHERRDALTSVCAMLRMSVSGAGVLPMGADMMRVRTTSSGKQVSIAVTPVVAPHSALAATVIYCAGCQVQMAHWQAGSRVCVCHDVQSQPASAPAPKLPMRPRCSPPLRSCISFR